MSETDLIQARVLIGGQINGIDVQPNDLVQGPADLIQRYVEAERLDKHESAVAYCQSNGVEVISLIAEEPAVEVTDEMIVSAIKRLDKDDPESWTNSGVPKTQAIEAIVGGKVKAADRDAAWRIVQEETDPEVPAK